jgi:CBS domain-containing protein
VTFVGGAVKIRDIMTRDVQKVRPEDTVQEAARIMSDIDAGALPVGHDSIPDGMVTDRDIIIRVVAEGLDPKVTTVREIMSADLATCRETDDAQEVAEHMKARQVRRMPVLDQEDRMVGIVALSDIARGVPADQRSRDDELREAAGDKPGKHDQE